MSSSYGNSSEPPCGADRIALMSLKACRPSVAEKALSTIRSARSPGRAKRNPGSAVQADEAPASLRSPLPFPQGNRVKELCGDEACEEVVIPGGDFAAESEGILSPGSPD